MTTYLLKPVVEAARPGAATAAVVGGNTWSAPLSRPVAQVIVGLIEHASVVKRASATTPA
jgi:hypothetical protein